MCTSVAAVDVFRGGCCRVQLTHGGGSGGGRQWSALPWAPQMLLRSRVWYVCKKDWHAQARTHTHTQLRVSKRSETADPAASLQLPLLPAPLYSPALYGRARRSPSQLLNLILSSREAGEKKSRGLAEEWVLECSFLFQKDVYDQFRVWGPAHNTLARAHTHTHVHAHTALLLRRLISSQVTFLQLWVWFI